MIVDRDTIVMRIFSGGLFSDGLFGDTSWYWITRTRAEGEPRTGPLLLQLLPPFSLCLFYPLREASVQHYFISSSRSDACRHRCSHLFLTPCMSLLIMLADDLIDSKSRELVYRVREDGHVTTHGRARGAAETARGELCSDATDSPARRS